MDRLASSTLVLVAVPLALTACGEPSAGSLPEVEPPAIPPETSANYALEFDGQAEYATTATSYFPIAKASQSTTLWIKPGASTGEQAIFTFRRGTESGTQLGLNDGLLTAWSVWGMRVFAQSETALNVDAWYHVAFVQVLLDDAEDLYDHRLYLDGVLVAQGALPPQSRTPTSSWLGSFDGASKYYVGCIDELRLYARALSDDEVASEAMGTGRPSGEGLVAAWSFDEPPGSSVAYDRSGNDNHATLGDGVSAFMPERVPSEARSR